MPIDLRGIPIPLAATPLERNLRRVFTGALVVALIAIVAALATRTHAEAVVVAAVLVIVVLNLAVAYATRRSRRALEANHFLICPRCLTTLADRAAVSICPVCNFDFESLEALEELWRHACRIPREEPSATDAPS
jgi:lysylphosphatidylglycerol synthetase-like protein (DUF2156 family)